MNPKLSIVTGKLGRDESFQRLLESLYRHTEVSFELVVADASSVPYPPDQENVRVLHEVPRLGCCKGYNRAFRECRGEFVIWLNDDCEVLPGYAENSIRFMEEHPEIGLGALHYSENGGPFHVNSAWKALYANFGIFRKVVGESVEFFDEELYMYGCDNSFALRILLANYGVADIPDARVIHHSMQDDNRIDNQRRRARDNEILTNKYMPSQAQWVRTFNRLRVPSGEVAWSHGVPPRPVHA